MNCIRHEGLFLFHRGSVGGTVCGGRQWSLDHYAPSARLTNICFLYRPSSYDDDDADTNVPHATLSLASSTARCVLLFCFATSSFMHVIPLVDDLGGVATSTPARCRTTHPLRGGPVYIVYTFLLMLHFHVDFIGLLPGDDPLSLSRIKKQVD